MPNDPALKKGLFVQPRHLHRRSTHDSRLAREEIFGPVTVIAPFDDPEAVLAEANDSEYGLAATLWTNNLKVGLDLAHRLEAGLVQVNQNLVVQANLCYGGVKQRPRQGSLAGGDAGALHPQEDDHGQHGLSGSRGPGGAGPPPGSCRLPQCAISTGRLPCSST